MRKTAAETVRILARQKRLLDVEPVVWILRSRASLLEVSRLTFKCCSYDTYHLLRAGKSKNWIVNLGRQKITAYACPPQHQTPPIIMLVNEAYVPTGAFPSREKRKSTKFINDLKSPSHDESCVLGDSRGPQRDKAAHVAMQRVGGGGWKGEATPCWHNIRM